MASTGMGELGAGMEKMSLEKGDSGKGPAGKKSVRYWGVRKGHTVGVYQSHGDAVAQVRDFPGSQHKAFDSEDEAERYVRHLPSECTGDFPACQQSCKWESLLYGIEDDASPALCCGGCNVPISGAMAEVCQTCSQDPTAYGNSIALKYNLDDDQLRGLSEIASGKNVLVTGSAGVGKSRLVQAAAEFLRGMGRSVVLVAPTALPASNIGGRTFPSLLHTFVGWKKVFEEVPIRELVRLARVQGRPTPDVLILDEASMIESLNTTRLSEVLSAASNVRRAFGGAQVVACADMLQLPPLAPFRYCMQCGKRTSETTKSPDGEGEKAWACPDRCEL